MKNRVSLFLIIVSTLFFNFQFCLAQQNEQKLESLWYYTETPRSRESLFKNIQKINILAPQVYELGMNGEIKSNMKSDVVELAQKNKVKVMPLLANTNGKVFNQKTLLNLLSDTKNWEKVSKYMREEAYKNSFYGWQMDLENLPIKEKTNFENFIKYLHQEFQKDNLVLSIAVVSKISDNPKDYESYYWNSWAGAYDYKILSANCDFLSIMAYDQPNSPGPVATLNWSKKVLDYSLKNVSPEKISFGIPVYGWAYRAKEKKHFTMIDFPFTNTKLTNFDKSDLRNMTTGAGTSKYWGNISWVSYNQGGKNYTIWYEDRNSFLSKLENLKNKKIRGFSVWVLGDEDPKIWDLNL